MMSSLGSEFDKFLFAVIGEDRNGMALSVISVLARKDLDPWQEAATLAAGSKEMAAQRLASLLAALPERTLQQAHPEVTAARLIALLPQRVTTPDTRPPVQASGAAAAAHPRHFVNVVLIAIYMILSLGIQLAFARRDPVILTNTVHVPAAAAVPSQTLPTTSDK
jgi:hypothetical protein